MNNPRIKTIVLLGIITAVWTTVVQFKQQKESLNDSYMHVKKIHHQQCQHQEQLKEYAQRFQDLNQKNKLKALDPSEIEEFFRHLCTKAAIQVQDLRIKSEDEKSLTEYPTFYCAGHLSAVVKVEQLEDFYDFVQTILKDFPGIIVYKTVKISKMINTTTWVGLIDFSYFNTDLSDYKVTAPSVFVPSLPTPDIKQAAPLKEQPFVLKAILYCDPQNWTIWLNDQKISTEFVNDHLRIAKVTPTAVHFIRDQNETLIIEPGENFVVELIQ